MKTSLAGCLFQQKVQMFVFSDKWTITLGACSLECQTALTVSREREVTTQQHLNTLLIPSVSCRRVPFSSPVLALSTCRCRQKPLPTTTPAGAWLPTWLPVPEVSLWPSLPKPPPPRALPVSQRS